MQQISTTKKLLDIVQLFLPKMFNIFVLKNVGHRCWSFSNSSAALLQIIQPQPRAQKLSGFAKYSVILYGFDQQMSKIFDQKS